MSKEDEDEFLVYLRSLTRLVILPATCATTDFPAVTDLPEASEDEATRRFWLQNPAVSLPLVTEYIPEKSSYQVDEFQSPVVEFVRSLVVSRFMLPGRITAEMNYIDTERQDLAQKPIEFRKWFDSMESWIRRKYTRLEWLAYAGPGAQRFRRQGGMFHQIM